MRLSRGLTKQVDTDIRKVEYTGKNPFPDSSFEAM
jgi:hypothetical protein